LKERACPELDSGIKVRGSCRGRFSNPPASVEFALLSFIPWNLFGYGILVIGIIGSI
jgi:hypothetical protein